MPFFFYLASSPHSIRLAKKNDLMKPSNIIASTVMVISITSLLDLQQHIQNDGPVFEPAETMIGICDCCGGCVQEK